MSGENTLEHLLTTEYSHCETNIRIVHEQRDRWIRFYLGFVAAIQAIPLSILALQKEISLNVQDLSFWTFVSISSVFLYATGVLVLMICIYSRCRTVEYTNELNTLRFVIHSRLTEGGIITSGCKLPRDRCVEAYRTSGADFFRHLLITFIVSLFIPILIISLYQNLSTPSIVAATLGYILSISLLLAIRRKILVSFDKELQLRQQELAYV